MTGQPARELVLHPTALPYRVEFGPGVESLVRLDLLDKVVASQDIVTSPRVRYFGRPVSFRVKQTDPVGHVRVVESTRLVLVEGEPERQRGWFSRLFRRLKRPQ